ncbi:aldo/keto reductase [Lactiplantibacillus garii]|uniref:Aldo/keto reductase n=1 Tax=Lactiplantibacillus garii TaxID=2306423 RepID=A0A3R8J668_9LACO|nr:aldo/keto reductase [Lactiplantibacillus garii]RRK09862.1 aldo/keto reductase [Lactiplantibacillus garii]
MSATPKIVLGTWAWGDTDNYFGNHYDEAHFQAVYDEAIKDGLNFFDTAYAYSKGNAEKILGNLTSKMPRQDVLISTKFTPRMADDGEDPVSDMFKGSTERLKTDYFDYYWIHHDDDVEKWTPKLIPLLQAGKVKHVGVSNHTLPEIKRVQAILGAAGFKLSGVQNHFSLLDRTSEREGILDYCKQNGLTFFAYMVLEQGALTGKYDVKHPFPATSSRAQVYNQQLPQLTTLVQTLTTVGANHDLSAAQTAMAWAVAKGALPIIGVTKVAQVDQAAQVAAAHLSADEVAQLDAVGGSTKANTVGFWEPDFKK